MDDMIPLFPLEAEPTPLKIKILRKYITKRTTGPKPGQWEARLHVLLDGENRYKVEKGHPTKEKAEAVLREWDAKVESGEIEAELRSKAKRQQDGLAGIYCDSRTGSWRAERYIKDPASPTGRRKAQRYFKTKGEAERALKFGLLNYELNLLKTEGSLPSARKYERAAHQKFEECRLPCSHTKNPKSISHLGFKEWFKLSAQKAQDFLAEYFTEDRLLYKNGEELKEWAGNKKTEVVYVMRPEHKHIEYGDTCKIGITRAYRLQERIRQLSYESNTDVFCHFVAVVGELEPGSFRTPGIRGV
tara:strand:- start:240 stop:1145 length:906 start_codon:yes stop_codon:yes gene_type:complete